MIDYTISQHEGEVVELEMHMVVSWAMRISLLISVICHSLSDPNTWATHHLTGEEFGPRSAEFIQND